MHPHKHTPSTKNRVDEDQRLINSFTYMKKADAVRWTIEETNQFYNVGVFCVCVYDGVVLVCICDGVFCVYMMG